GERAGIPFQEVRRGGSFTLARLAIASQRTLAGRRSLAAVALQPFDLETGPLLRVALCTGPEGEQVVLVAVHHLVCDFWSLAVVLDELERFYVEHAGGPQADLAPLPASYADHVRRQREWLASTAAAESLAYWQERLAGELPRLNLPYDRAAAVPDALGARAPLRLGAALGEQLRVLAGDGQATLFMVLLAGFEALLRRYCGQDDLLVGVPAAGRPSCALERVVGYFVDPLVLRIDLSGDPPGSELLRRVAVAAREAMDHRHLPFAVLVDRLRLTGDPRRSPLIQAAFTFYRSPGGSSAVPAAAALGLSGERAAWCGSEVEALAFEAVPAPFELTLVGAAVEDELGISLLGRRDLFDRSTMTRMSGHLCALLADLAASPERRLSELALLSAAERHQVLIDWNACTGWFAGDGFAPVERQVAWQAARRPEAVAVSWGEGQELTYGELDRRSSRLALQLRRLGVAAESRVGLLLPRSPELALAALSVLKAGGAYLPLDPSHPAARLAWQLDDAAVAVVLTVAWPAGAAGRLLGELGEARVRPRVVTIDLSAGTPAAAAAPSVEALPVESQPESLAYVIYTSGSTGTPKGVAVPHRGLSNLVSWHRQAHGLGPGDRATLLAGVGFDASVWELWSALTSGAALHVPAAEVAASPRRLAAWLAERRITQSFVPTPLAEALLSEPLPAGLALEVLLTGGDRLHRGAVVGQRFSLVNHYGPTESSVVATWITVPATVAAPAGLPPIGRPIANTQIYVVDGHGRPVPAGVAGEIWIGGHGLARGYLGRPELTAERFVPAAFAARGERLYRSGDRGRWLADGRLEFLGRVDRQVKVRGFRIEVEEIEAQLLAQAGVREAVVVLRQAGGGEEGLAAYWVPAGEPAVAAAELREALGRRLPEPMLPRWWTQLPALPLTANGKVDRRALPAPAADEPAPEWEGARTPVEEIVAGIWCEVLGLARVGVADDFFTLGGHSLLATQVASRLLLAFGVELPLATLFERTTLAALAAEIETLLRGATAGSAAAVPPIRPQPRTGSLPLSFAQQRLWFIDQLEPGSPAYNLASAHRAIGSLDAAALRSSFGDLVARHETLRTVFTGGEDGPVQRIGSPWQVVLPYLDLSPLGDAVRRAEAERLIEAEVLRPFDLARGPLLRTALLRLAPAEHVLVVNLHHIAGDGWSAGVLVRELATVYEARCQGRPSPLPALPIQYADFAAWQRRWLSGAVRESQLTYWQQRLAGASPVLALPTDRPRPAVQSFRGSSVRFILPPTLAAALQTSCRRGGVTSYMFLLGAFATLLSRYTGETDLNLGMPVAGRNRIETEGLIGFFVNTLVLRCDLSGDPIWADLLLRLRRMVLEAHAHQDLPFEMLVEALQPQRSLSHEPLFQVVADFHHRLPAPPGSFSGLAWHPVEIDQQVVHFDLILTGIEGNRLGGSLEYRTDLFDAATIRRMVGQLEVLLDAAAAGDGRRLAELPLLTSWQRHHLIGEAGCRAHFPSACLDRRFASQAARRAEHTAVVAGVEELTYRDLDRASNRLAHRLRAAGVGPEVVVGICLERSPRLVTAILAVLKAGGAYLPLDPAYPRERLAFMLRDAGAPLVVTEAALAGALPPTGARVLALDDASGVPEDDGPIESTAVPQNLAYLIYTSGSTGRPRGVLVSHGHVSRLLDATREWFDFGEDDVWTLFHSFAFDFSVWEIWGALAHGGRLVVVPYWVSRAPERFHALLAQEGVTVLNQTPSAFRQLIAADELAAARGGQERLALRVVIFGGEALDPASLAPWLARHGAVRPRLVNMYGITETTVHVTGRPLAESDVACGARSVIGQAIPDLTLRVLGPGLHLQPIGVPGELCVGGAGLARAYQGLPERTAEKFVPDPWAAEPGARLYRSGDLGRRLPDGDLEYLGRIDHQVKVRGFRIELGEVEAALAAHPEVRHCVVSAQGTSPGDVRLVAYL
ncbi:MAG TPA: amino acid adenylation domain-containing protein, partial [Thermoanaerobaculia bacterium]